METEIKITPPPGYEIDKENSTLECIKFRKKTLTYEDIAEELFLYKTTYFVDACGGVRSNTSNKYHCNDSSNCCSAEQVNKLMALNKLINVAKYLNGDWKPDFQDHRYRKYYITHSVRSDIFIIDSSSNTNCGTPCFKLKELAEQAIKILGEETIKLALSQV